MRALGRLVFPIIGILHPLSGLAQNPGQSYVAPLHNFTVPVPDLPFGTKVKKSNNKETGFVLFLGGAGEVKRIDYARIDPPITDPLDSLKQISHFRRIIQDFLLPEKGTVLRDEPVLLDSMLMLFTAAVFPEASAGVNMATGKRFDAVRGLLIFIRADFTYVLTVEPGGMFVVTQTPEERGEHAWKAAQGFYATMAFP